MQTKYKNGKWKISTSKTEMEKLDSTLGWLKPLTELSTSIQPIATEVSAGLETIREFLVNNARPTTEET